MKRPIASLLVTGAACAAVLSFGSVALAQPSSIGINFVGGGGPGDPIPAMLPAQFDSLTRLLRLPDWVAVFPGHFEGPCGKGMCGRPSTTLGFERLYNPLARLDRTQFVARLTQGTPPRPLNMTSWSRPRGFVQGFQEVRSQRALRFRIWKASSMFDY